MNQKNEMEALLQGMWIDGPPVRLVLGSGLPLGLGALALVRDGERIF